MLPLKNLLLVAPLMLSALPAVRADILIFNNNFSASATGTYTNGTTINPGAPTAQLKCICANTGMTASIVSPGQGFASQTALDLTNNGATTGILANRADDGNSAWNQIVSGATGNNFVTCSYRFVKLQATGGVRFYLGNGSDYSGATQVVRIEVGSATRIVGNLGATAGPTDPGYTLAIGTPYQVNVQLDLSSTTQHTYTYNVVNLSTGTTIYTSPNFSTRNATAVPDRVVLDWGNVAPSSTSPNAFVEFGQVSVSASPKEILWRIGIADGSHNEFTKPSAGMPATYTINAGWATQTTWPEFPASATPATTSGSPNYTPVSPAIQPWSTAIQYNLSSVPSYGVVFDFQADNASIAIPELAVYSNGSPAGIIQIAGTNFTGYENSDSSVSKTNTRVFSRKYQVYIPAEFLKAGANTLTIAALGHPYDRTNMLYLEFSIDYMQLNVLHALPAEPLNGKTTYFGAMHNHVDTTPAAETILQPENEWMGIAYSGNPARAGFWNNLVGSHQAAPLPTKPYWPLTGYDTGYRHAWLQELKDLNMSVVLEGWNCAHYWYASTNPTAKLSDYGLQSDGTLYPDATNYISDIFSNFGGMFQFYEICNEPCTGDGDTAQSACTQVASYINGFKSNYPGFQLDTPGYAYGGGAGSPVNWDLNDNNRIALDGVCDVFGGHAYAISYAYDTGDLTNSVDAHGVKVGSQYVVRNGWDKPMIVTECGANTWHRDQTNVCGNSTAKTFASMHDRNLRAHIGYADYMLAAMVWAYSEKAKDANGNFLYYKDTLNYIQGAQLGDGIETDTSKWQAITSGYYESDTARAPHNNGTGPDDTRLKVLRRLTLAYATHGQPLPYVWNNLGSLPALPLVYFRAVDTSKMAPLPATGATSSKILLSLVNFDTQNARTISVTVTLPSAGTYTGVYYDDSTTYTAARHPISLTATPQTTLTMTLNPGASVEYILDQP